jgi:hypothetical protein
VTWRLDTVAPDLVERLEGEEEPELRRLTANVAQAALREQDVRDESIDGGLAALREGRFGDSEEREAVKAFADRLDELAWDLQERVDAGEAEQVDYLTAFRKARGATALWFALDADARTAAIETAYEAQAATDDGVVRRELAASS